MSKRRREKNDVNLTRTDQPPGLAKKIKISRSLRSHKKETKKQSGSASTAYVSPECRTKPRPGLVSRQSPACSTPRARRYRLNASHSESDTEIIWDGNSPTAHLQRRIGQNGRSTAGDVLEIVQCVNNQMHNIDDRPADMPLLGLWMNRSPHHPAVDLGAVRKTQDQPQHESSKSNSKKTTHKKSGRLSVLQAEIEKIANAVAMAPTNDALSRQRSSPEDDVDDPRSVLPSGQEPGSEENGSLEPQLMTEPVDAKIRSGHVNCSSVLDEKAKTSRSVAGRSNVNQSVSHQFNTGSAGPGQPMKSVSGQSSCGQSSNGQSVGDGHSTNGSLVNCRSDARHLVSGLQTTGQSVGGLLKTNKSVCQSSTVQLASRSVDVSHPVIGQPNASRSVSIRSNTGQSTLCCANSGHSNTHQPIKNQPTVTQSLTCNSVVPSPTASVQSLVEAVNLEWDDDSYFEDEAVLEQLSQTEAQEISKQMKNNKANNSQSTSTIKPNVSKPNLSSCRVTVSKTQSSFQVQQAKGPVLKCGSSNPVGKINQQDGCSTRAPLVPTPQTESSKLFVPVPRPSRSSAAVANSGSLKQPLTVTSKPIMDSKMDVKNQGASDPSQAADGLDWDSLDLFESSLTDEMMMALCDGMDSPPGSKIPGQESLHQDSKSTSSTSAPTTNQRNGFAQKQDNNMSTSSIRWTRQSSAVHDIKTAIITNSTSDKVQTWKQSNKFSFSNKTQATSTMIRDYKPPKTTTTTTITANSAQEQQQPNNSTSWNKSDPQKMGNPRGGPGSGSFTFKRPTKERSKATNPNTSSYAPVGQTVLAPIPNRQLTSSNTKAAGDSSRLQPFQPSSFVNQQARSSQPAYASTTKTTMETMNCKASVPAPGKTKQIGSFGNSLVTAEVRNPTAAISTHSGLQRESSSSATPANSGGSQQFCSQLEIEKKRQQALARRQRKL